MPKLPVPFSAAIEQVREAMAEYAGPDDSPPMLVCNRLLDLCAALEDSQRDLARRIEAQPPRAEELLQAARKALFDAVPAQQRLWVWHRWAVVCGAAGVVLCAVGMLAVFVLARPVPVVWNVSDLAAQCAANTYVQDGKRACTMSAWVR